MEIKDFFNNTRGAVLSSKERREANVLIVDSSHSIRQSMRQSLTGLGFSNVLDVSDHRQALEKLEEESFSHIIFEAKQTKMPARDFLLSTLELNKQTILIPSSYEPTIDDVFDLLIIGARGFIVKPFSAEALDNSMVMATKGDALSDAVIYAKNRNEALAAMILSSLDKLALVMRQGRKFETAKRDIPKKEVNLRKAVDLGLTFAKGGPLKLHETLINMLMERAEGPSPHAGRLKKRVDKRRAQIQNVERSAA